jgi:hypothetical protein
MVLFTTVLISFVFQFKNHGPQTEVAPVPSRDHPHTPALLTVADLPYTKNGTNIILLYPLWHRPLVRFF